MHEPELFVSPAVMEIPVCLFIIRMGFVSETRRAERPRALSVTEDKSGGLRS